MNLSTNKKRYHALQLVKQAIAFNKCLQHVQSVAKHIETGHMFHTHGLATVNNRQSIDTKNNLDSQEIVILHNET